MTAAAFIAGHLPSSHAFYAHDEQVRPPQPCVFLFLIDASTHAIAAGSSLYPICWFQQLECFFICEQSY